MLYSTYNACMCILFFEFRSNGSISVCTLGGGSGPASLSNGVFVATACVITFMVTLIAA